MTLINDHLEQIEVSAKALGDLEFPPPKLFTNALLGKHEITTLIRDTEPHERALFSVDPNVTNGKTDSSRRRTTVFGGTDATNRRKTLSAISQGQTSAVAKVLGNDMLRKIQQSSRGQGRRGVNVEVLLQGAERLCAVYAVAGAGERIAALRSRHDKIAESVASYEAKVVQQQAKLNRLNSGTNYDDNNGSDEEIENIPPAESTQRVLTEDEIKAEEEEIRELEARKKALEDRVAGMEKDLGGLLR